MLVHTDASSKINVTFKYDATIEMISKIAAMRPKPCCFEESGSGSGIQKMLIAWKWALSLYGVPDTLRVIDFMPPAYPKFMVVLVEFEVD
jgi:hypothetical protein